MLTDVIPLNDDRMSDQELDNTISRVKYTILKVIQGKINLSIRQEELLRIWYNRLCIESTKRGKPVIPYLNLQYCCAETSHNLKNTT